MPVQLFHHPVLGSLIKDRTFNGVLQLVLLRRTGRSVIGWSAWRQEGAFGLAPAGLWVAVGALG
jgi:hypothetical protein